MVILSKKSFKLPRVDKEKFILLLRLGLEYNRNERSYSVKSCNNIDRLVDTISSILNEEITFLQSCLLCGKDFPCSSCKYHDLCATRGLPFHCVCPQCLKDGKSYDEYVENSDE